MNTTGIQNYLSNVFRPIYTYDSTTFNFTPRLELSNIDVYSGNSVNVFTATVGDSNNNVYVGRNAGNPFNFLQACSNVTALGYAAAGGISNDSDSVYIGYNAGFNSANARDIIAIGANAGANGGASNIFLGTNTKATGSSNIFIGHQIGLTNVSNQIRIGYSNQIPIAADLSANWVGLGGPLAPNGNNKLDVSGDTQIQGRLGINITPNQRTFEVNGNFRSTDGPSNILDFSNGFTSSTGGFGSIQSTTSSFTGTTPIGTIKKGIIHVSAVDQASPANRAAYIYFAWSTTNVTSLAASSNGTTNIVTSSTDIQISNSGAASTYDYNVTYFPMP